MKKITSTILLISLVAIAPFFTGESVAASMPGEAIAATMSEFKPCPSGTFRVRKNTRTKKKVVNSLIAGGIGAAIGGGIGGGRGALVGLGSGAGGYLVYRYVRDRRGRCVPKYVRG